MVCEQKAKMLEEVLKYGKKAKGRAEFIKYLKGEKLTRGEAILAKCYDCVCHYADGKVDCELPTCPLYDYMPYRGKN